MFIHTLQAGWGDMDYNGHMRNTAYLDCSASVRMIYFQQNGFPMSEFARLRLGPVVLKDEIEYFREIRLLEEFQVWFELAGFSEDGRKCRVRNTFIRPDGKISARVTSFVGWMDLAERKLIVPPENLYAAMVKLGKTEDYQTLE